MKAASGDSPLARRLRSELRGEVLFGRFDRGRYATDASIYQMMPLGVVVPRDWTDVAAALDVAREEGVPVLPRGGGTSQCGQTVNEALVLDLSKHLDGLLDLDVAGRTAEVEPGLVLDSLNSMLKPHGLWFPVDVSTGSRATLGGMAGNNSCGSRSIRYGTMRDNVEAIEALLADGTAARFGSVSRNLDGVNEPSSVATLFRDLLDLGAREADEIRARFPDLMRRVGGYNIDALVPNGAGNNLAHLLVGSEGSLALTRNLTLRLSRLPENKVLGICHFPAFAAAMEAAQHIVPLSPTAVELVDRTMIDLARQIPMFRPVLDRAIRGTPEALLLVEFAEDDSQENERRLAALGDVMAERGFRWGDPGKREDGVVEALDPGFQKEVWEMRKQGLNIVMSMKSEGKPVSFVEDCAVRLEDLAEYTARLTEIFRKHGTDGTWYAHASVGTLHVRPVLNLKLDKDVAAMRAIAEECFEMVRGYKGSHSGEHGDGIVRSEFHEPMFGRRMVESFGWVKDRMDPAGLLNPGKIVRPPKMDDRRLFRYGPDYAVPERATALDWSGYAGAGGGFQGAIEMCNNNGACRKLAGGVMCPSYRVTRNERDLVRGRANSLRLAISGQLGPGAFASAEMAETMKLCVGCKGCRRECPTGVDMAKMKIEVQAARAKTHGISLHDRLVAYLPRYAPVAASLPGLANLRETVPGAAGVLEGVAGLSATRRLPRWRRDWFRDRTPARVSDGAVRPAVLFADTFNRYFEPENLRDATDVLKAAGFTVFHPPPVEGRRLLCCGRTFLAAGLVEEARHEARRMLAALGPFVARGIPVVGLEPACLFTLRDEFPAMLPGGEAEALAERAVLLEELIAQEAKHGNLDWRLNPVGSNEAYLHGHCHQKAFDVMGPVQAVLELVPGLQVKPIESSCCGMAGAFGYHKETVEVSRAMGELSLMPAVRKAPEDALIVADGTSCRQQIGDGTGRSAVHVAQVLRRALAAG